MRKILSRSPIDRKYQATRWLLLLIVIGFPIGVRAQRVESLSQAKTVYVEAFRGGVESARLHDSFVRHLAGSRFKLVQSPKDADAIITGNGQIWIRGFIAINPRTPTTDRQAVYAGYLSIEVADAYGQPLWSWLATPSKLAWSNIVGNLAGKAAKKLVEATESAPALSNPPAPASALAQTSLNGAGASWTAPLYKKWFEDFEQFHSGVRFHYSPVGSQLGDERLGAGELDFAGSDFAPEVAVGAARASNMRRFATVLGAVVPIYNVQGVTQNLRFTGETLADIYLGRVRRWNDSEIRISNKGVHVPDAEISVIHRSDGSGTSWVWSDFLSKVSPIWSSSVGRGITLHWPVGTGAEYNEGMANAVQNTPNSIGYVELAYAIQHQLNFGAVRNRAGEYIRADLDSLTEAARASGDAAEPTTTITDPYGKYAYPISAFAWIVVPAQTTNPAKRAALIELLRWALTSGQNECSALGYVPLPRETVDREIRTLNRVE
jgi:phosphate ABC transporter phosphate-binding protein